MTGWHIHICKHLLFATETLWRPSWSMQRQTSSYPAVPGANRVHWCHQQTGGGPHTAPTLPKTDREHLLISSMTHKKRNKGTYADIFGYFWILGIISQIFQRKSSLNVVWDWKNTIKTACTPQYNTSEHKGVTEVNQKPGTVCSRAPTDYIQNLKFCQGCMHLWNRISCSSRVPSPSSSTVRADKSHFYPTTMLIELLLHSLVSMH